MREPDLDVLMPGLDALVRQPMRPQDIYQDAGGGAQVARSRGPLAAHIALVGDYRGLVDRDPQRCQVAQLVGHALCIAGEIL